MTPEFTRRDAIAGAGAALVGVFLPHDPVAQEGVEYPPEPQIIAPSEVPFGKPFKITFRLPRDADAFGFIAYSGKSEPFFANGMKEISICVSAHATQPITLLVHRKDGSRYKPVEHNIKLVKNASVPKEFQCAYPTPKKV